MRRARHTRRHVAVLPQEGRAARDQGRDTARCGQVTLLPKGMEIDLAYLIQ